MQPESTVAHANHSGAVRPVTLIWIDARDATLVRWRDAVASVARIESDVPPHHRDSQHPDHDDSPAADSGEPADGGGARRLEHLARFIRVVAARIPVDDDLMVLGPGTVREDLERVIRTDDRLHHRSRGVLAAAAERMTEPQLIARARGFAGDAAPRRPRQASSRTTKFRPSVRRRKDYADDQE